MICGNNSERILLLRSLIKENINFWEDAHEIRAEINRSSENFGKVLSDFVARVLSALRISETIIQYPMIVPRNAAKYVLNEYLDGYKVSCDERVEEVKKLVVQCSINIFYNKQKTMEI